MTDAPALILVPLSGDGMMDHPTYVNGEWSRRNLDAMLSASPYIDGVPVEVVERMAEGVWKFRWATALGPWEAASDAAKNGLRSDVRAALLAAGIKVAD